MIKLREFFSGESAKTVAKDSIKVGNVYRIKMDERNGIKPKVGDNSRNKFFIILGFDSEGNVYGGVIINSCINPKIPQSMKDWHIPIKCSQYSFLDYDSFVDCSKLKTANIDKFRYWEFLGAFSLEDVRLVIGALKSSPNETQERLVAFGL